MAQSFQDRVDSPDGTNDAREIWMFIRSWLTIIRVVLVIAIILVAEIFEEHNIMLLLDLVKPLFHQFVFDVFE